VPGRPTDVDEGATAAGAGGSEGDTFSARLAGLRALLAAPPDDDSVAERYGELVELARGDEARMDQVRRLGDELRALQDSGELPRTMLARAPRRPTSPPGRQ
jgi:hypothetical protein